MTTPAQSINIAPEGLRVATTRNALGVVTNVTNTLVETSRYNRTRPASVYNPIRPDGTRKPSNWTSSGGSFHQNWSTMIIRNALTGQSITYDGTLVRAPGGAIYLDSTLFESVQNDSIRDALGHFGDAQVQAGVALREAGGTVKMLAEYYKQLSHGLGRVTEEVVRNGSFRKSMRDFKNGWKGAPSQYLKYIYGVRPLSDDIVNATNVLTEYKHRGYALKMSLHGRKRLDDERTITAQAPHTSISYRIPLKERYSCKSSLVFKLPDWYWDSLPTVTGLSEAWEHMPYSFVLDWALPIGNWLRGFEGLQLRPFFTEGCTTTFFRSAGSYTTVEMSGSWTASLDVIPETGRNYWYMKREILTSFPTERVMSLPRLRNVLRIGLLDQFSALAGQRFAKLSKAIG